MSARDETPAAAPRPPRRRGRTALAVLAGVAVVAGAALAASGVLGGNGDGAAAAAPSGPPATAEVTRTTLTRTETVTGTLGYGEAYAVQAPAPAGAPGIVTWLPDEGRVIERGEPVYAVNEQEVPLLYGTVPLYRTLTEGLSGGDVETLEENLAALGYDGFTADRAFTAATAEAVAAWQRDLGREATGTVAPGDAVVAPGARRVAAVPATTGAVASGELLTWTGTERLIGVDLDAQLEDLVEEGTAATVTLPDGTTAEAEVTEVGTPTTPPAGAGGEAGAAAGEAAEATLPVELRVADQAALGRYQAARVDVTLDAETREDVLAVPVHALAARPGGGYAVEAVTGDTTAYVPVEVGLFANGMVEISGDGVAEGTVVGVPR